MKITVNGEVLALNEKEVSLNDWLNHQEGAIGGASGTATGGTLGRAIVEYNGEIIPQERWDQIILKEGDTLEIFKFVGGGR